VTEALTPEEKERRKQTRRRARIAKFGLSNEEKRLNKRSRRLARIAKFAVEGRLKYLARTGPERWLDVLGMEGSYMVSSHGRILSLLHGRAYYMKGHQRWVTKHAAYHWVLLMNRSKDGARKRLCSIHRLVMIAFSGGDKPELEVNHKDGNGLNNRLDNLEWVTSAENSWHAQYVLGHPPGTGVLNKEKVREIRALGHQGVSQKELAGRYGVSAATIERVLHRKRWAGVD